MKRSSTYLLISFFSLIIFSECGKIKPRGMRDEMGFHVPEGWLQPVYSFANNPWTLRKFELGKRLFYDPVLSRDSTISCASCHKQEFAFTDGGNQFSVGVLGAMGERNSSPLYNLAWHSWFMYDGGIVNLEIQPFAPIVNHLEMDESLPNVIDKLNAITSYKSDFLAAFGSDSITSQLMFKALAQFTGSIVSDQSKYDFVMRGEGTQQFTEAEQHGYTIFKANCAVCHAEPLFSDFAFRNNGLPFNSANPDYGRFNITFESTDSFKFKMPSLRNIEVTSPYMHDGRFTTLEQVLDHYASGVYHYTNTDPLLLQGIQLTAQERYYLLQFLKTLTDKALLTNPRFKP